ncbi:immunity 49 family protein [Saccharothrix sp. NRRL B-16348]|uniref:immunity 49 family protein n=1 Tax=Saccharothrix sp. NRRL B-16348 TaxID=1415542 RepID=UPI0006AFEA73|nr:immunity 49 family protein [Saccharothrix sp. NRRL B-16348]
MPEVSRHDVDAERSASALRELAEDIEERLGRIRRHRRSDELSRLMLAAVDQLGYCCAVDPDGGETETLGSLLFAAQVGDAIFELATTPAGATAECALGDGVVPLTGTGPAYYATASNWLLALSLAITARQPTVVDRLASVPLDILRASGAPEPLYLYDVVETFQRFVRRESATRDALNAALRGTDPTVLDLSDKAFALFVVFPQLQMFHHLTQPDHEQQFAEALVEALELHREYWAADERAASPEGYLALGPLALAVLANDAGNPLDVRSEYLPQHLLDGPWSVGRG